MDTLYKTVFLCNFKLPTSDGLVEYFLIMVFVNPSSALFPGPAQVSIACSTKSGGGSEIVYHMSDIEDRKKVERS